MGFFIGPTNMELITRQQAKEQNLQFYFTGKPCKRGHVAQRRRVNGSCNECATEDMRSDKHVTKRKQYYIDNKEYMVEYAKRTYDPIKVSEYNTQYREDNKEKLSDYRSGNISIKEYNKIWADKNPNYHTKYRKNHAAEYAIYHNTRRLAKMNRTTSWRNDDIIKCYYSLSIRLSNCLDIPFQVDHIIPLQGKLVSGLHVETNLQVITAPQNRTKSNSFEIT
jgi:hypothetical protein